MEILDQNLSGFIILLVLGLRHGLDPDHITVIDGYTYQLNQRKSLWAPWVGTFFTFGHGLMVTIIALVLSLLKNNIELPDFFYFFIEWLPLLMLLMIGFANLNSLLNNEEVKISSFRKWLLPKHFSSNLNPFSIILTGVIFGFIFDTSSQIAAFGMAISSSSQWMYAVMGGIIFSIGLMLTGTFDSLYLSKLLKTFDQKKIKNHRKRINILITLMCFAIPIYKISCLFKSDLELDDFQNNMVGLGFIAIVIGLYTEMYLQSRRKQLSDEQ